MRLLAPSPASLMTDLGLLVLRLASGGFMVWLHGWGKITTYAERAASFESKIGLSPAFEFTLLVGAEVFCAIAIILGLFTRLAAIPLIIAMLVAALIAHADDPMNRKELPLFYACSYLALALAGAGRYSLDALLFGRRRESAAIAAE